MESTSNPCRFNSDVNDYHTSDNPPLPISGIRATVKRDNEIQSTSTLMPCDHCTNEKIERRKKESFHKRCYYCHEPGHQIISCKMKENDEATQLIRQAINTGIQRQEADDDFRHELIVTRTEGGLWSEIWYIIINFKHHYAGNLDVFKRIKHMFGVETKTGESNFLFIRGIGAIDVMSGNDKFRIQSVFYTPELDRNVLSMDQLVIQGYTVKTSGERCRIFPTFSVPVSKKKKE
ncbi:putative transcription factor interactor and regulator CCHC(Zn) family [Helianthus annuus]|uniref:Transcription factor interactor and regulator CCHC(Zn) family n=1 Tax=Helianthus annuus TaxID=4232 RepID=A0A9K3JQ97_HELAN|nr:putative transcription factor interactor and regulator CCHC(Zn) family [Helianthus annuus]